MAKENTAELILREVGGKENVVLLTHCATRLRFTLKDATIIKDEKVDAIPGVMGVVPQSSEAYQIVIGGNVADVYEEIDALLKKSGSSNSPSSSKSALTNDEVKAKERNKIKGKSKIMDNFFEFLSDSFRPMIGVLLGASLIIALLNLLISLGVIKDASDNTSTLFLNAIAQSVFYFLPVIVAFNACKKLKVEPWIGAVCMLSLFTPQFLALINPEMYWDVFIADGPGKADALSHLTLFEDPLLGKDGTVFVTSVFGLPMILNVYKGNVFVPLLMSGFLALLYKGLKKIIPSTVQLVFVPFLSMIITVPVTAFIIGPIGVGAGSILGIGLSWLNNNAPFIFAIAIPLMYPFLVPLGLHWPLNALMLVNIDTLGYDFIQGPMGVWNYACFGCTFGVLVHALRERNFNMANLSGGALAAGFLGGVSEPSLYGIHLRYKRIYKRLLIGCGVGGVTIAVLGILFPSSVAPGVTDTTFAFTSILTIPLFDRMWVYAISIAVSFTVSATLVITLDYRTPEQKAKMRAINAASKLGIVDIETSFVLSEEEQARIANRVAGKESILEIDIAAPVDGNVISLDQCGDKAFAKKALGEGIAIEPEAKKLEIKSPVTGTLTSIANGKHAYTIMSEDGIGVLVHIGVDTVKLEGEGFDVKAVQNIEVGTGDTLVEVDFEKIKNAGYKIPVIVTVVNTNQMNSVEPLNIGNKVTVNDKIIIVKR